MALTQVSGGGVKDGSIYNADINSSAAIDKTKINGTAITAADTGTITGTMLANGTVTSAKLAPGAGGVSLGLAIALG